MLLTSKDANKLLKQLNDEYSSLQVRENQSKVFVAATIENKDDARPNYDYEATSKKLAEISEKIIKIKHAINKFNVETIVPEFNKTIDEMLVYIPQLTSLKGKLSIMKDTPEKERYTDRNSSNIIEYQYINYDLKKVEEDYKKVETELADAQIALDKINVSKTFEVNL